MRNVNLNILKILESINNFCLSLANIGLEVRSQESGVRSQESGVGSQELGVGRQYSPRQYSPRLFLFILPSPPSPSPHFIIHNS
ncbi:MAG: hypothetical protein EWV41_11570 [Microcystis wesenbergii Mw_MB_S_20031200_S109]|uniref:Uncharacterized protein n=1 Tax=Microcystis wesenbergii Mw_MB_S_20031200_S109D TaxID=2486241 RepID=A0A552LY03_9CHRO|nr:MAG: hypothetical protein EWV41_11570 [Microcystis wesenbergii Mw_MB_S_20031200_S109]TRV25086.1 MAG: hypothetical protein EWV88_08445 [Microcystis wesenbergii Mw_MB_S_20031200_S109D]